MERDMEECRMCENPGAHTVLEVAGRPVDVWLHLDGQYCVITDLT